MGQKICNHYVLNGAGLAPWQQSINQSVVPTKDGLNYHRRRRQASYSPA
jgi:hypothetical protein